MGLELCFWLIPNFVASAIFAAWLGFFLGPLFPAAIVVATKLLPRRLHVSAIGFAAAFGGGGAAVLPFAIGECQNHPDIDKLTVNRCNRTSEGSAGAAADCVCHTNSYTGALVFASWRLYQEGTGGCAEAKGRRQVDAVGGGRVEVGGVEEGCGFTETRVWCAVMCGCELLRVVYTSVVDNAIMKGHGYHIPGRLDRPVVVAR